MKKIIIFGANCYGEKVFYSLDDKEYDILYYVDNNKEKWGMIQNHIKIMNPTCLREVGFDYVIIAYGVYEDEIRKQLIEDLDILQEKILTFQPEYLDIKWQEDRISMLRKCIAVIKERNIRGNMAEVGVYQGEFAKYLNRYLPDRKLYLFDTFSGYPDQEETTGYGDLCSDTSTQLVLDKMENRENCILCKGYFPNTAQKLEDTFCLVSLDTTFYKSILDGLEYFYERLEKGGYLFVHDYGNNDWKGCKRAVLEFCEKNEVSFVPILDRCGSVIITK
ncbi:MAG: TylF/MycF/NovP-related O-methyltransferase [Acetivibrio sp.]